MWDIVLAWWPSFFVIVTLENSGKIRPRSDSDGAADNRTSGNGAPAKPMALWGEEEQRNE